jgi:uncharacterized protein
MNKPTRALWNPSRLDASAFAQAGDVLEGRTPLSDLARLAEDLHLPDDAAVAGEVVWSLRGEMRAPRTGTRPDAWVHLIAAVTVPLTCQRCLGAVATPLDVDRWFRFVADEAAAEAQDDDCEEDLLALEPRPDMLAVLEDELLMALPLVPMHETCPEPVPLADARPLPEAEPERPHPFAQLARLRPGRGN